MHIRLAGKSMRSFATSSDFDNLTLGTLYNKAIDLTTTTKSHLNREMRGERGSKFWAT